jgi:thiamine biosynthesis lipoprotein
MVGVQNPEGRGALGALPATDVAIVTSGDYQRYFEYEGKRYAHILDPRTGWPLDPKDSPKSVTMVSGSATDADAFCTAVAVMGPKRGMEFVESRDDLDAIIIDTQGDVLISTGLRQAYRPFEERHDDEKTAPDDASDPAQP